MPSPVIFDTEKNIFIPIHKSDIYRYPNQTIYYTGDPEYERILKEHKYKKQLEYKKQRVICIHCNKEYCQGNINNHIKKIHPGKQLILKDRSKLEEINKYMLDKMNNRIN